VSVDVRAQLERSLADRYRLERELGAGGMATVYLAHDLKYDRHVAIKVVHPDLAAVIGAERFLAEIRVTAQLQHPHILPLFDSGETDGQLWYAMPYVEGETLRDRLAREQELPIEESVRIARQVGSALDYAHRHGVVHRDIKPENILLLDGTPLVADFGIALAVSNAGGPRLTQTGLSLGTPQYMSPEQASGAKHIDGRTDVYSLGCVLYEMLAGEPPFTGPNSQAIVARVLTESPQPIRPRRDTVPPAIEAAVLTAIAKLPADRHATAADFVRALDSGHAPTSVSAATNVAAPTNAWTTYLPWGVAAVMAIAAVAMAFRPHGEPEHGITVSTLLPPEGHAFSEAESFGALSPDGQRFAFVALGPHGTRQIWMRHLDTLYAEPVAGTEEGRAPFFSPDGSRLAFLRRDTVWVANLAGGAPQALCAVPYPHSGAWGAPDVIVVAASKGIYRGAFTSGVCSLAIKRDSAAIMAPMHPSLLSDGRHVLFTFMFAVDPSRVVVGDLETGAIQPFLTGQDPTLVGPGLAVFGRWSDNAQNTLWAQRFDERSLALRGSAVPIASRVRTSTTFAYAASASGALIFAQGLGDLGAVITDRAGRITDSASVPGTWSFQLAHDKPWLAAGGDARGLKIFDLNRRVSEPTRFRTTLVFSPAWSPRDTAIAFAVIDSGGVAGISVAHVASGTVSHLVAKAGQFLWPTSWSGDGRHLVITSGSDWMFSRGEIWEYDFVAKTLNPVVVEKFSVHEGALSPDNRWLAYRADATGTFEVWVRPFLRPGAPHRISSSGGRLPRWRNDGRELYYQSPEGHVMVVGVSGGTEPSFTAPRTLFAAAEWTPQTFYDEWATSYDVSGDGQRFALRMNAVSTAAVLVQHWMSRLKP